jgi:hypothetical protein
LLFPYFYHQSALFLCAPNLLVALNQALASGAAMLTA